ncbi:LPXTG-site transpeptidase family protein [Bacillus wiedmannii]|jgi:sortase (surface protein transpeptidase)|nr:LPXTG-site transpeptidase family protein [Bacillus wiedmannii]
MNKHWITDAEDRTIIVEKDKPTLTLTTCYPFIYIGDAPDRYIIEASLISTTLKEMSQESFFDYVTSPFYFRNITITLIRYSIINI